MTLPSTVMSPALSSSCTATPATVLTAFCEISRLIASSWPRASSFTGVLLTGQHRMSSRRLSIGDGIDPDLRLEYLLCRSLGTANDDTRRASAYRHRDGVAFGLGHARSCGADTRTIRHRARGSRRVRAPHARPFVRL